MFSDLLPFTLHINPVVLSGVGLWALALYLGFSPISDWVIERLSYWFNNAERFLHRSQAKFEQPRLAQDDQNVFYASLLSIVPFLAAGATLNYVTELSLGRSWAISTGILAVMGAAVYELGRRDGQVSDED